MERIDYIETEARVNAAFHIAGAEVLQKEANTLMNVLLAVQGGGIGLILSLVQRDVPVGGLWAVGFGIAYLFLVSLAVVLRCLWARDLYPPSNEPMNLGIDDDGDVVALRKAQLRTLQDMIDMNRRRNERVAWWLNRCRLAAAGVVPVVIFAAFGLY